MTHDLSRLLALLGTHAHSRPACPVGIEDARQLNPFAVRFRYEDEATEPEREVVPCQTCRPFLAPSSVNIASPS